ncbi:alpha/beta hydrolase-fold protein [candidate division KSB1 bacterium]
MKFSGIRPFFFRVIISTFVIVFILTSGCKIEKISSPKFEVSFTPEAREEITSGRILLMFSRDGNFRVRENGIPVFGLNVDDLAPGDKAVFNENVLGYPVSSLKDIPAGEYQVKAVLNVYTTFNRSDGHVIKLHMDRGEGQNWQRSPGNLFNDPVQISYDPSAGSAFKIVLDKVIPPIAPPEDTEWVKNVRIKSELLSEFWGQDMYIGAKILLPKGFNDHPEVKYPVEYIQGHFSSRNPGRFREGTDFYNAWTSDDFPRMLLVTFQHANPYYDDSYGVNSENAGPYGDALTRELIPYIEQKFRAIGKPYSRVLSGGSTGGWISLALQVWYPDFFGGTWTFYPDQVDFRKYQIVNILEDENAYYQYHEWTKVPRPGKRSTDGNVDYTMAQECLLEEVLGDRYRSGGQWAIWNAVYAPVAADGYPEPIWNPLTGKINHETAKWSQEHFDIRYYLENNWETAGPKLEGKIHVLCGRMDNYYLNEAVYLLEEYLEKTVNPYYGGYFKYGPRGGHGWNPLGRINMMKEMAEHITENAPPGENTDQWKY